MSVTRQNIPAWVDRLIARFAAPRCLQLVTQHAPPAPLGLETSIWVF
jgi:hypothetical protein